MKKLLITLVAVSAISFSSYGFSAQYRCEYPQSGININVSGVEKNFQITFYVRRTDSDHLPYIRYVAYSGTGSELVRNYVHPKFDMLTRIYILKIYPTIEDVYKFNLYFVTVRPGDYEFVSISW